jgi:hypothetical protein
MSDIDYKIKYLKYKNKYIELKKSLETAGGDGKNIFSKLFNYKTEPEPGDIVVYKYLGTYLDKCGTLFYFVKYSDDKKFVLLKDKNKKTKWLKAEDISLFGKQGKDYKILDKDNIDYWGDFRYPSNTDSNKGCL